jgi:hypothetical protein
MRPLPLPQALSASLDLLSAAWPVRRAHEHFGGHRSHPCPRGAPLMRLLPLSIKTWWEWQVPYPESLEFLLYAMFNLNQDPALLVSRPPLYPACPTPPCLGRPASNAVDLHALGRPALKLHPGPQTLDPPHDDRCPKACNQRSRYPWTRPPPSASPPNPYRILGPRPPLADPPPFAQAYANPLRHAGGAQQTPDAPLDIDDIVARPHLGSSPSPSSRPSLGPTRRKNGGKRKRRSGRGRKVVPQLHPFPGRPSSAQWERSFPHPHPCS